MTIHAPQKPKTRGKKAPKRPQPKKQRIARTCHLTDTEKWQLVAEYQALPKLPTGKRAGVAQLEISRGVASGYIAKLLAQKKFLKARPTEMPAERKERADKGVPRKMTPEVQAAFAEQDKAWNYVFTFEQMEEELQRAGICISDSSLLRWTHEQNWNTTARTRTVPLLTNKHRAARVEFATAYLNDGAPPHVGKDAEARIDAAGKKLRPPVKVIRQPSQSPDCNLCDLSFFRALASCVAKRRRGLEKGKRARGE